MDVPRTRSGKPRRKVQQGHVRQPEKALKVHTYFFCTRGRAHCARSSPRAPLRTELQAELRKGQHSPVRDPNLDYYHPYGPLARFMAPPSPHHSDLPPTKTPPASARCCLTATSSSPPAAARYSFPTTTPPPHTDHVRMSAPKIVLWVTASRARTRCPLGAGGSGLQKLWCRPR